MLNKKYHHLMKHYLIVILLLLLTLSGCATLKPSQTAIATAHPLATAAGEEILKMGGNAFDAAVAVTAAVGVVEPYGSGLGGGGFWLLHRNSDAFQVMIDGREKAPLAARRNMYLDEKDEIIPGASINGPLAAGIPGVPAAMAYMAEHYGKLTLKKSLAPAIRIARNGFEVDERYRFLAKLRLKALRKYPSAAAIFLHNNDVPENGYVLKQPDLANTLESIAAGDNAFYSGKLAAKIISETQKSGGIWSLEDFKNYTIKERKPIIAHYKDMKIISASLPSSGGIVMASILNMLDQYDLDNMKKVDRAHIIIEAMRRAYRDRAEFLGDSDFINAPVKKLTSAAHAKKLLANFELDEATASARLKPVAPTTGAGNNTTHFSILDKEGNRVAATLSVNYPFGSCYVAPGTGFLQNNEMDDFSAKPGVPNAYGLVGAEANSIQAGKRPLSSMSPTFLENDAGVAILGTPGGSRIISMVLLGALEFLNGGDAQSIVDLPRFHHQYLPDIVIYEDKAFNEDDEQALTLKGHQLKKQQSTYGGGRSVYGNMQAIVWHKKKNKISAASDHRGVGKAIRF